MDERGLWWRYAHHDGDAYAELWRRHESSLFRQALRQAGHNREVAEEAMGRLALRLARPNVQTSYDPTRPWRPWAGKILRNLVIEVIGARRGPRYKLTHQSFKDLQADGLPTATLRKLNPLKERLFLSESLFRTAVAKLLTSGELERHWRLLLIHALVPEPAPAPPTEPIAPSEQAEWNEIKADYLDCLEQLTPRKQAIVIMRDWRGTSFWRIVEIVHGRRALLELDEKYRDGSLSKEEYDAERNRLYQETYRTYRQAKEQLADCMRKKGHSEDGA